MYQKLINIFIENKQQPISKENFALLDEVSLINFKIIRKMLVISKYKNDVSSSLR